MISLTVDGARFARAVEDAEQRQKEGIGMLGEKTVHAAMKNYFSGYDGLQEQKIGRYYVDVLTPEGVIEVQSASFSRLRGKIAALLKTGPVTVVYPIVRKKRVFWIDPESGEISKGGLAPKTGAPEHAAPELLYLSEFIGTEGFSVVLAFYDADEYRRRDGWGNGGKRGAHRVERKPTALCDLMCIASAFDCKALLPDGLPAIFTAEQFGARAGMRGRKLWAALRFLEEQNALFKIKEGRRVLYRTGERNEG